MKQPGQTYRWREQGITSFFVVIFAATLLTIIVVSFAALMIREQSRSSDDELSQSAYDAAMAGVEDAKRVIMLARSGDVNAQNAISTGSCSTIADAGVAGSTGQETLVQSTTGLDGKGSELQQAYTCVVIKTVSDDIILSNLQHMQSQVVALKSAGSFDKVVIEWHSGATGTDHPCGETVATATPLCPYGSWGTADPTIPPMLRAQFIVPQDLNALGDLDLSQSGNTAFLYPKPVAGNPDSITSIDMPRFVDGNTDTGSAANNVKLVECSTADVFVYRCKITIDMPREISVAESEFALLRLTSIYKDASLVRITLLDAADNPVQFNGAQPVVDSTGRANDLFRRVEARLSLASDVRYPEFAVDTGGAFCKNFWVVPDTAATAHVGEISPTCQP